VTASTAHTYVKLFSVKAIICKKGSSKWPLSVISPLQRRAFTDKGLTHVYKSTQTEENKELPAIFHLIHRDFLQCNWQ